MGRTLSLEKIPSETRNSFLALIADQPGLTLDDHVEWFSERGYTVSRSAVHRYISAQPESVTDDQASLNYSIRLQCLTIASGYTQAEDKSDLIRIADELVSWVKAPR